MPLTDSNTASSSSNRGRGKNRGGLGKYLRARGRGHRGAGRPAEFRERLVLDGEQSVDDEDEEAIFEREQRFRKRQLSTNADRYKEEEPELGSDGEPIVELEVDLSAFIARQRLEDNAILNPSSAPPPDEEALADIDTSLAHIGIGKLRQSVEGNDRKGKLQTLDWDDELEDMKREKDAAEAQRNLIGRFRTKVSKVPPSKPIASTRLSNNALHLSEAPPLPTDESKLPKSSKEQMEDFLDDLLT